MNVGRRIAFTISSSAIYGMLASIAIATMVVEFQSQSQKVTWLIFIGDLKLIGFFLFLPALILGGIGGVALSGFRKSTQRKLMFIVAAGAIGAILGIVFIGLSSLFDPTTSPNAAGNAPALKVFVMAVEVGSLVGVSYAMIFYRWIKASSP